MASLGWVCGDVLLLCGRRRAVQRLCVLLRLSVCLSVRALSLVQQFAEVLTQLSVEPRRGSGALIK